MKKCTIILISVLALALTTPADPPPTAFMDINPATGYPAAAWSADDFPGKNLEIAYSVFDGTAWSEPEQVSRSGHDCVNPAFAFDNDGNVFLLYQWKGPFDAVYFTSKAYGGTKWNPSIRVTSERSNFANPTAKILNTVLYIAFEEVHPSDFRDLHILRISELLELIGGGVGELAEPVDFDEWFEKIKVKTANSGDILPLLHSKAGKLWIDWIDSPYELGWTKKLDDDLWAAPYYKSYSSQEEIPSVRREIEEEALSD